MKGGDILFQNDLNKLNERRDNENEYDSLKILKLKLFKKEIVYGVSYRCRKYHYEGYGNAHSRRLTYLFGNSEEGADAEKLCQNVVIDKDGR